jgi:hypothetical protein
LPLPGGPPEDDERAGGEPAADHDIESRIPGRAVFRQRLLFSRVLTHDVSASGSNGLRKKRVRRRSVLRARARAHENDRNVGCSGIPAEARNQLAAVHLRHHEIRRHETRSTAFDGLDCNYAVRGLRDLMAGTLEGDTDEKAHARLIVNDQDRRQDPSVASRKRPGIHPAASRSVRSSPAYANPTFGQLARRCGGASVGAMVQARLAWTLRGAVCALAVAATTAQLVDFGVYGQRLRLLDMTTHRSIFGVASLAVLALAACASVLLAAPQDGRRRHFAVLAGILAFLLAVRIAQPPHVLLLSLPGTAAAFVLLWTAPLPASVQRLVREGCIVLVAAFVVHGIGEKVVADLGYGPETWAYQIKAVVKHSGELAGWALVAGGLVLALPRRALAVRRAALHEPT